jgi:hypothetical protein
MQEFTEEHIQNNLDVIHVDEEACLFELVAYKV